MAPSFITFPGVLSCFLFSIALSEIRLQIPVGSEGAVPSGHGQLCALHHGIDTHHIGTGHIRKLKAHG